MRAKSSSPRRSTATRPTSATSNRRSQPADLALAGTGGAEAPQVVVAGAGYRHRDRMDQLARRGIKVLIPPDAGKRKGARPGWTAAATHSLRRMLETNAGAALYGRRQMTIEPVFANTRFNGPLDRFCCRRRSACRSEWRLITATHNLLRLHGHPTAAAGA
jgi:hypothetical protein